MEALQKSMTAFCSALTWNAYQYSHGRMYNEAIDVESVGTTQLCLTSDVP
jgi:hypothetical protein